MKKIFIALGIVSLGIGMVAAKSTEPVIMTVNNRPVYKSEFEYLYNKNAGQQVEHQSLDEYVDMFVKYKLKVADAVANGLDTTTEFVNELEKYRVELAAPYMRDEEVEKQLIDEAYQRKEVQLNVSHIMFPLGGNKDEQEVINARVDSVRNEILADRLTFEDAAARFSIDRASASTGGKMNWFMPERFPLSFVEMAYATEVGEISEPVNSGYGIHLIRVNAKRKNPGEVRARHILKLTARKTPEEAAKAKPQIDSLYNVLTAPGADFADIARRESEDPGSASRGGDLDWFSSGAMVAPFDSAAFTLADSVISKPFRTSYGWHIVQVLGHRPLKSRAEMEKELRGYVLGTEKGMLPEQKHLESLRTRLNSHVIESNLDVIRDMIAKAGAYDSTMIAKLKTMDLPVVSVDGKEYPVSDVMAGVAITASKDADNARSLIASAAERYMNERTMARGRELLMETNSEYRNLVNEYSDGILLFDISKKKVWDRAATDLEGLDKYFAEHKDRYTFDEPRYKAFIIFAANDSIAGVVEEYTKTLGEVNPRTFAKEMREKFGRDVRVERVIAKKGENAITDYLAFGGEKPESKKISWHNYFAFRGKIITAPEDADDVRGKVTTDYQNTLEEEWVEQLRKQYRVDINKKVLKKVKEVKAKK